VPAAFPIRWQFERRLDSANTRLAVALAASLLLHGAGYLGWKVLPPAMSAFKSALQRVWPKRFSELSPEKTIESLAKREVPLVFVEVDPALASAEPPKDTRNYSTHNSLAANEQPRKADIPKIDGQQTHVLRTADNPKPQPKPLQPAPVPEPKRIETSEPEAKPKPAPSIGDLAMAKPEPKSLKPADGTADKAAEKPYEKPRTIREAMARNPALAGQKTQQDGGVERRAHVSMLDAKGSPFGNYDSIFIAIVQERWYALLDDHRFMLDQRGKVSLTFQLHQDGRITQLETAENTVGDILSLLCQKAILDPAPFPKWPAEMRKLVGTDTREVRFTFYYD
jgi:hypothetical protein